MACVWIVILLFFTFMPPYVAAANLGPRTAQVVDAETKRQLAGVNVLAVFCRWPKPGFWARLFDMPPPARVFRDSVETVTDDIGRFSVVDSSGDYRQGSAEFHIFKLGYRPWRFQLVSSCPRTHDRAQMECEDRMWDRFGSEGVVIELRPLGHGGGTSPIL